MSIFNSILNKLGFGQSEPAPTPYAEAASQAVAEANAITDAAAAAAAAAPAPISTVDVVAKLEELAAANPQKLNWKVSIADLMRLLGLDSSLEARKELATELGCPPEKMGGDHAQMNIWLHKTVLQKLADNGGNIPLELL